MKKFLFVLLITGTLSAGCTRYYYKPNAVNAPLFTDKNQFHFNAVGMAGGDGSGTGNSLFLDFQAAYSPVKYVGVMANYSTWFYKATEPNPVLGKVDGNAHLLEAGIGGYYSIGNQKIKVTGELFAGGGAGKINSDVNMDVRRYFLQPGIGMRSKWIDIAFHVRMCQLRYSGLELNDMDTNYLKQVDLEDKYGERITDKGYFFTEPCLTLRGGYRFAKLQFQIVYSRAAAEWNYNPVRFTAGIHFSLEDALKRKTE